MPKVLIAKRAGKFILMSEGSADCAQEKSFGSGSKQSRCFLHCAIWPWRGGIESRENGISTHTYTREQKKAQRG